MPFALPPINLTLSARDVNCCNGANCCIGARNGGKVTINAAPPRAAPLRGTVGLEEDNQGTNDEEVVVEISEDTPLIFDVEHSCIRPLTQKELKSAQKQAERYQEMYKEVVAQCYDKLLELGKVQREVLLGVSELDLVGRYQHGTPLRLRDYRILDAQSKKLSPIVKSISMIVERILYLAPPSTLEKQQEQEKKAKEVQKTSETADQRVEQVSSKLKDIALDAVPEEEPQPSEVKKKSGEGKPSGDSVEQESETAEDTINRLFLEVTKEYDGLTPNDFKFIRKNARIWNRIRDMEQAATNIHYVSCSNRHAVAIKSLAYEIDATWKEIKGRRKEIDLLEVLKKITNATDEHVVAESTSRKSRVLERNYSFTSSN